MYLQLCSFNSSHVLTLVSKEGETEHSRMILIDLMSVDLVSAQTSVSVPWKIDDLIKVPDTEEELFSIGLIKVPDTEEELFSVSLTRDKEFDCYTFTLVKGGDSPLVAVKTHRRFTNPFCKYKYSVL